MMQYVTIAATVFLVLEILIVGIGILIGYRRGLGRTLVRAVYLAIIGVVSFFAGRNIAATVTKTAVSLVLPMLPDEIVTMLESMPELEILLENLVGALLVPIIFAALFAILQLLTLIFFKKLSTKIVSAITKKQGRTTAGKWTGAAAGLVLGIVIAAVLLAPMYTVLHIVESTPEETFTIFEDAIDQNGMTLSVDLPTTPTALRAQPSTTLLSSDAPIRVMSFSFVNELLVKGLTTYAIPSPTEEESGREAATDTLPVLLETAGDALYAYNVTKNSGGTAIDAIANAAAAVTPHLCESSAIKHIAADALYLVGVSFRDNGSFMDIELPESDNAILTSIVSNLVDTLSKTTPETVEANMTSLFGKSEIKYSAEDPTPDVSINKGLLSAMTKLDKDDPMQSLEDEQLSEAVSSAIGNLADNENMSEVLTDIKDFAVDLINSSEIDLSDEKYDPLYEEISADLSNKLNEHIDTESDQMASVSDVAKDLEATIESYFTAYDVPMGTFETSVLASCIAQEFYKEENIVDGSFNITVDEVLDFFGITQSDIDNFLNGDTDSGEGSIVLPEDFDVNDLPEDFDVNDLPEDFDINDLPEDFDANDLPEDFDINDLPEGFDASDITG